MMSTCLPGAFVESVPVTDIRVVPGDVASSANAIADAAADAGAAARERRPVPTDGVADGTEAAEAVEGEEPGDEPVGRAATMRCDDGTEATICEELGGIGTTPALPPDAIIVAMRRARASSVLFATSSTSDAISGARAMGTAPSMAPASCRAV